MVQPVPYAISNLLDSLTPVSGQPITSLFVCRACAVAKCSVSSCNNVSQKHTSLLTGIEIEEISGLTLNDEALVTPSRVGVPLCTTHYNQVYSIIHKPVPCQFCGIMPHKGRKFARKCPNPAEVACYTAQCTDFSVQLTEDGCVVLATNISG